MTRRRIAVVVGALVGGLVFGSIATSVLAEGPLVEEADKLACSSEKGDFRLNIIDHAEEAIRSTQSAAFVITDYLNSGEIPVADGATESDLAQVDAELDSKPAGEYVVRLIDGDKVELREGIAEVVVAVEKNETGGYRVEAAADCFGDSAGG
jgi:hypothetical protein